MSRLEDLAESLRDLARDAGHLSQHVLEAGRRLDGATDEAARVRGVNVAHLMGLLQTAHAAARQAGLEVDAVRATGLAFADRLVGGGGARGSSDGGASPGGGVTDTDRAALLDYTTDGYQDLNAAERGERAMTPDLERRSAALSGALSKLPDQPGIAFRGTSLTDEQTARYEPGTTVSEPAFMSATSDESKRFSGNTYFFVRSRHGKDVSDYSPFPESEVLFDKRSRFYVQRNEYSPHDGRRLIFLIEVD